LGTSEVNEIARRKGQSRIKRLQTLKPNYGLKCYSLFFATDQKREVIGRREDVRGFGGHCQFLKNDF